MHDDFHRNIGILTFHRAESYGAVLQAYALQKTVSSFAENCNVGIIDFQPNYFQFHGTKKSHFLRNNIFNSFVTKHLNMLTENHENLTQCLDSVKQGKLSDIIVGSDQVWNPDLIKDSLKDYLLDYSMPTIKKHSYAASFGTNELKTTDGEAQLFKKSLASFTTLTVREKSALDYCHCFGRDDAKVVLDPTLLANPSIYDCIGSETPQVSVCAFFLKREDFHRSIVLKVAKIANVSRKEIVFLASKRPLLSLLNHIRFPSVESFISHFKRSKYIITDSFHGVCFSIIFQKEFLVIPSLKHPERFCRIKELLQNLGLLYRIISPGSENTIDKLLARPINYEMIEQRLKILRKASMDLLQCSLLS